MMVVYCAIRMTMMMVVVVVRCRSGRARIRYGSKRRAIFAMVMMAFRVSVMYQSRLGNIDLLVPLDTMVMLHALSTWLI